MRKSIEIVRSDSIDESFIQLMNEFSPVSSQTDKLNGFAGEFNECIRSSDRKITCFSSRNLQNINNSSESYPNLNTDQLIGLKQEITKLEERLTHHLDILTQNMEKTNRLIKYIQLLEVKSDENKRNKSKTKRGCGWRSIFANFFIF